MVQLARLQDFKHSSNSQVGPSVAIPRALLNVKQVGIPFSKYSNFPELIKEIILFVLITKMASEGYLATEI